MKLILASGSPRRRDLMTEAGLEFEVTPADVEEIDEPSLDFEHLVTENARLKSAAVADLHPEAVVIGADTLVALEGRPLGKPRDLEHAFEMIQSLAGRTHVVGTSVCLTRRDSGEQVAFLEKTAVTFRELAADQIREYLGMIDPLDKAGGYAAQEHGEFIIEKTEGSWTNIVGLPMERLLESLARFR